MRARPGFRTSCDRLTGPGGAILHWNGAAWAVTRSPSGQFLYGIAAVSAMAAFAAGVTGVNFAIPVILHWNGATWTICH